MSLETIIHPGDISLSQAKSIAEKVGRLNGIELLVDKKFFSSRILFFVDGVHEILTDQADWNAETWDMEKEGLASLASILERFMAEVKADFSFSAMWVGEKPKKELTVSGKELLEIIKSGQIGTRTRYFVTKE